MGAYKWFVVIVREGVTEAVGFYDGEIAGAYFDQYGAQWSESYLCEVKDGPKV